MLSSMAGPISDVTPTTKQWACLPRGKPAPPNAQPADAATGDRAREVHTGSFRVVRIAPPAAKPQAAEIAPASADTDLP